MGVASEKAVLATKEGVGGAEVGGGVMRWSTPLTSSGVLNPSWGVSVAVGRRLRLRGWPSEGKNEKPYIFILCKTFRFPQFNKLSVLYYNRKIFIQGRVGPQSHSEEQTVFQSQPD